MRHNTLFNYPNEREAITYPWVTWSSFLTDVELANIRNYCEDASKMEKATTLGDNDNPVRNSIVCFHERNDDNAWFFDKMNDIITQINNRFYGFDLNGYHAFQYTEYHEETKQHYGWHMDMCLGQENLPPDMIQPRKLSLSLLLNQPVIDFKGGDFQFNLGQESEAKTAFATQGQIIAFPSWMLHRVLPVIKGVRKSIVIWVCGPKFT